jgi:WD40 repeat protein
MAVCGNTLLTGSGDQDRHLRLWDVGYGDSGPLPVHPVCTIGAPGAVLAIACLDDWVFSGGEDHNTLRGDARIEARTIGALGRLGGRAPVLYMKGHEGSILSLQPEARQTRLYSCGRDASVRVWDAREDLNCIQVLYCCDRHG